MPLLSKKASYWPVLIACCVLVGGAMWASALLPDWTPVADEPRSATATTAFSWRLGVWEGRVARFAADAATPTEVYDVSTATLPEEVQQSLAAGIPLTSEEELATWLDNLTS